jgi:hypothetical protein
LGSFTLKSANPLPTGYNEDTEPLTETLEDKQYRTELFHSSLAEPYSKQGFPDPTKKCSAHGALKHVDINLAYLVGDPHPMVSGVESAFIF